MTFAENKKNGLIMATVLVTVNMVGTGIFLLPVTMASIGSISIWGWAISCVGATALGLVFALLGAVDPEPGGRMLMPVRLLDNIWGSRQTTFIGRPISWGISLWPRR